ncbi:MAG: phytanoyl-CoA dioxygenase family protein [Acidimicrobiales bacterium]
MTLDTGEPRTENYFAAGHAAALAMDNRGPIRFAADGSVHPDVLEAYWKHGFYVFEDVVGAGELAELQVDIDALLERAPYPTKRSTTDKHGRPALGLDFEINPWLMTKPLSDPWGGKSVLNGRHQVKMHEPVPAVDAPADVPFLVSGCLELSETFLRVYGHPDLLRVAEAVNGPDFTPFNEVLFVKEPGLGPSVSWHQDGQIHWDSPDWNPGIHGFNFQLQLWGSTPGNGVWVVPGSHTWGKVDIKKLIDENGGDQRLPDAIPLVCGPGDLTMTNRQTLHGSFPNTSPDRRITVNFGFHRHSSVINQHGMLSGEGKFYDQDYVTERCRTIALAIDARAQHFPNERPYIYAPLVGQEDQHRYTPETRGTVLRNYNRRDIGI